LSAIINSACGSINLMPKNIFVGIPQVTNIVLSKINGSGYWCANSRGNYFDIELEPGLDPNNFTFELQLLNPITSQVYVTYTVNGGNGTFVLPRPANTNYLLQARIINHSCGSSINWFGYEMQFSDCSNYYRVSNHTVYPNPAGNDLNIEYTPIEGNSSGKSVISGSQKDIKLFNNKGEMMLSSMIRENELKLV
jgi:hypothetical protein